MAVATLAQILSVWMDKPTWGFTWLQRVMITVKDKKQNTKLEKNTVIYCPFYPRFTSRDGTGVLTYDIILYLYAAQWQNRTSLMKKPERAKSTWVSFLLFRYFPSFPRFLFPIRNLRFSLCISFPKWVFSILFSIGSAGTNFFFFGSSTFLLLFRDFSLVLTEFNFIVISWF